jgi:hypothetical protein
VRGHKRLASLLEMYETALRELMSWDDPAVADLIIRLELWRTAAELELLFEAERAAALAA